jgi:hypothetical protein
VAVAKTWFLNFGFLALILSTISLTVLSPIIGVSKVHAAVWENTDSWTPEAEGRYHEWVKDNWTKDFFYNDDYYHGVIMDCAKAVYSMRLIYASEHGLPFVVKDPTGGHGVISNDMKRFDHLDRKTRLRDFLLYAFQVLSTASLPNDSYPVAITREAIGSGRMLITDHSHHHSWTVKFLSETGIPFLLFASRPARTELYERFEYPTQGFIFPKGILPETNAGFRNFRKPEDALKPVWEVPGYSLEQYQIGSNGWGRQMQKRLQLRQESFEMRISRLLNTSCKNASERAVSVRDCGRYLSKIGDRCMTADEFDDWSTPSKDARMKGTFEDLARAYHEAMNARAQISPKVLAQVQSVVDPSAPGRGHAPDYCPVAIYSGGRSMSLGQIYTRSIDGRLSSNPHDTTLMRWGLEAGPSRRAASCPVY